MNGKPATDIRSLSLPEITSFLATRGEPSFRAGQVFDWLWKKGCRSFDEMSNIPKTTRSILQLEFSFPAARVIAEQASSDGTMKFLLELHDEQKIESVLIPSLNRTTACISSQAGCPMGCLFCATGKSGFRRNLLPGEIFDQVMLVNAWSVASFGMPLTNIVLMGMGEPLLNYENVKGAVEMLTSPDGQGMSPQRITLSSVGIPNMIRRLADDNLKIHFALSLHAASDKKRDRLIPFNEHHPVSELVDALKYYHQKTGKRFTIEYLLISGLNDSKADVQDLADFCRNFPVKINIIEYNPVEGLPYARPAPDKLAGFVAFLERCNLVVNIRKSRGGDIDAACGQLAGKSK